MDWSGCELVEVIPGKVSGAPLVRGTRVPVRVIVENYELGQTVAEIHEDFPGVPESWIEELIRFWGEMRPARSSGTV